MVALPACPRPRDMRHRAALDIQASWAFTFSTMLPKAAGSFTAMSARTLRSISIERYFRPAMNLL